MQPAAVLRGRGRSRRQAPKCFSSSAAACPVRRRRDDQRRVVRAEPVAVERDELVARQCGDRRLRAGPRERDRIRMAVAVQQWRQHAVGERIGTGLRGRSPRSTPCGRARSRRAEKSGAATRPRATRSTRRADPSARNGPYDVSSDEPVERSRQSTAPVCNLQGSRDRVPSSSMPMTKLACRLATLVRRIACIEQQEIRATGVRIAVQ